MIFTAANLKIFLFRQNELGEPCLACLAKFINDWNTILRIELRFWLFAFFRNKSNPKY